MEALLSQPEDSHWLASAQAVAPPAATAAAAGDCQQVEASRYIKDMRLLVEYRHVSARLPSGMYILPSIASLHSWDGVVFVRRGPYRGGVFRFRVSVPAEYPSAVPRVRFLSAVFHPRVAPSGELELMHAMEGAAEPGGRQGRLLLPLLRLVHAAFYRIDARRPANPVAAAMYASTREEFEAEAARCAELSAAQAARGDPDFSICFSAPSKATEMVRQRILREEKGRQTWAGAPQPPPVLATEATREPQAQGT